MIESAGGIDALAHQVADSHTDLHLRDHVGNLCHRPVPHPHAKMYLDAANAVHHRGLARARMH
jgi:hypothetical protein